jgi:hypothetical protein
LISSLRSRSVIFDNIADVVTMGIDHSYSFHPTIDVRFMPQPMGRLPGYWASTLF